MNDETSADTMNDEISVDTMEAESLDHLLLVKLKSNEMAVVDTLYGRYSGAFVKRAIRAFGFSFDEAEDIAHEVFIRLFISRSAYDETKRSGKGWIWRIYNNYVIDLCRKRSNHPLVALDYDVPAIGTEATFERDELYRSLECAWFRLSKADRDEIASRDGRRGRPSRAWQAAMDRFAEAQRWCAERAP